MSAPSPPLLDLRAVRAVRGAGGPAPFRLEVPALRLAAGERLALVGASGSGKSTLLDLLALALAPVAAERFLLAGHDAAAAWRAGGGATDALRAGRIGYVLQTGALLPFLSARENIALPGRIAGRADPNRVVALAERLGVARHLDKRPDALSVGERQRVAIARALAHRPALVLADEPTASLDPDTAAEVMALLLHESAAEGAGLVVATHDHAAVARLALPVLRFAVSRGAGGGADNGAVAVATRPAAADAA